jgi:hypothetical protein
MFPQNSCGIESHIIKAFLDLELKVLNPCLQIKIVHLHKTELRNYSGWIGLHKNGDYKEFYNSPWCVMPIYFPDL